MYGARGLVVVRSDYDDQAEAEAKAKTEAVETGLKSFLFRAWRENKDAKRAVEQELLRCARQRAGIYDPEILSEIQREKGSDAFLNVTDVKCRALASWLREILDQEKPWTIDPTPIPDVPEDIQERAKMVVSIRLEEAMQMGIYPDSAEIQARLEAVESAMTKEKAKMAKDRARRMEQVCEDQMAEGGWETALDEFISDLATFKTAFICGPIPRNCKKKKWAQVGNQFTPAVTSAVMPKWHRLSPFDAYPSANASTVNDGVFIERYPMIRRALNSLKGQEGFDSVAINRVIARHPNGFRLRESADSERDTLENKPNASHYDSSNYDVLVCWADVGGELLAEWGMDIEDESEVYAITAWLLDDELIGVELNDDMLGRRPYSHASFENIPGTIWGRSLTEVIRDPQRFINAAARALANNMGLSSGPIVEWDVSRLPPDEEVGIWAWRQIQTNPDPTSSGKSAVHLTHIPSHAQEFMGIMQHWYQMLDEVSAIPRYTHGSERVGGAGKTLGGLEMLMGAAAKGIRQVMGYVDKVTVDTLHRLYDYNMMYHPDPSIKGDLIPVAKGASSMLNKESATVRRDQLLQATLNPVDMEIIGKEGRAEQLRGAFEATDYDVDKIVPTEDDLKIAQMSQPPPGALPGIPGPPGPL